MKRTFFKYKIEAFLEAKLIIPSLTFNMLL